MDPHAYAVIMAGGSGTRFWPLSRRKRPKQLLHLVNNRGLANNRESLLQATVARCLNQVALDHIYVVTSEALREATSEQLPDLPLDNLMAEPVGRNTAPCIGWAAATIRRRDPNAVLVVLPADHHVTDTNGFDRALKQGFSAAASDAIVTLAVRPTRPETGYGYIELGEQQEPELFLARRFVEKPNAERATEFVARGNHLWNSGIFFFKAETILGAIERFLPDLSRSLADFDQAAALGTEQALLRERYPELASISIDYGVMEKAERVLVIPAAFDWSDVGSFASAWELASRDQDGNALPASAIAIDSHNCLVLSEASVREGNQPAKTVALIGVDDLVVIDTPDALLVVPRDQAQRVREAVQALKARGDEETL